MAEIITDGLGKKYTFRSYKPAPLPPPATDAVVHCPECGTDGVCSASATRALQKDAQGRPLRQCMECYKKEILGKMGAG